MRICKNCQVPKEEHEFPLHGSRPGLRRRECIKCDSKTRLARRAKNLEAFNAKMRQWHFKNKKRRNKMQLERYYADPAKAAEIARKSKYGLSPGRYNQMRLEQGNACAICRREKPLCVDHDHETKKVRGLLCQTCNRALGMLQDSPSRARSAAEYLDRA